MLLTRDSFRLCYFYVICVLCHLVVLVRLSVDWKDSDIFSVYSSLAGNELWISAIRFVYFKWLSVRCSAERAYGLASSADMNV